MVDDADLDYDILNQYPSALSGPASWALDVRHTKILFNILMLPSIRRYSEIGSGVGVSTTAAIECLRRGKGLHVQLCDALIQPAVHEMASVWIPKGFVNLREVDSIRFIVESPKPDLIFLDGDHSSAQVRGELDAILRKGVRAICAHDTMAVDRARRKGWDPQKFSGPAELRDAIQYSPGWYCLEDRRYREEEATDRGFFFATMDLKLFASVQRIFRYWADRPFEAQFSCRYNPQENLRYIESPLVSSGS